MKFTKKSLMAATALFAAGAAHAEVADDSRLKTVLERGSLLCSGHNGSFLGFAEVDDQGVWKGVDIERWPQVCLAVRKAIWKLSQSAGHSVGQPCNRATSML